MGNYIFYKILLKGYIVPGNTPTHIAIVYNKAEKKLKFWKDGI